MKTSEYVQYDATGLAALIAQGEISAREACNAALEVHAATDPAISAVIETWPEDIDEAIAAAGPQAPFRGVPFLIKDLLVTMKGKKCEDCSRLGEGLVAPEDSALMRRFRNSGVITFGRTKTPEFGFSPTTEPDYPGPAKNPWNVAHSPGGSSGGAGAVVAARVVPIAHASDAGGSIRIPASCCGVLGLKPSRGRVTAAPGSDEPLFGMATEFIVSRTVRDSALMLDLVQGHEVGDPYEIAPPATSYANYLQQPVPSLKIGLMPHPMGPLRTAPEVLHAVETAAKLLEGAGHTVELAMPQIGMDWESFIRMEAALWCVSLQGLIDGMSSATGRAPVENFLQPETYAAYVYGKEHSASDLMQALAQRNVATRSFAEFFTKYDILLSPVQPELPYALGTFASGWGESGLDWTRTVFNRIPFASIFNVTGLPAISVPLGHHEASDLPIGVHLGAAFGREDLLLKLAGQLEEASPWIGRMPAMTSALV